MVVFVPGARISKSATFRDMTPPLQTPPTCQTLERINKDFSPEADFEARQVTKKDFPGRYMYRDFGTQYWEATHTWVKEYLDVSATTLFLLQGAPSMPSTTRAWCVADSIVTSPHRISMQRMRGELQSFIITY